MISEEHIIKTLREIDVYINIYRLICDHLWSKKNLQFMTNQKWKEYKNDPKTEALFKTLEKQRKAKRKRRFSRMAVKRYKL